MSQISLRPRRRGSLWRVVPALLVLAHFVPPAAGQVFNYLSEPVDVSPAGTNAWVPVDVSAQVPAGATGVIIQAYNESSSDLQYGVRMNGSSDTWMQGGLTLQEDTAPYLMVGLDANRIFEVWQDNNVIITNLVGYTMAGVTFFQNATDKSLSTTGSWQDVNISADTGGDTAIGAIVIMRSLTTSSDSYAVRKKGSSDERYTDLRANMSTAVMIGVDASEIFQLKIQNAAIDTYLVGYITEGAVFFDNAVQKSIGSGTYTDIDISSNIGSDIANGAIVEWTTGDDRDLVATRMNGQAHDVYEFSSHLFSFIGVDAGNLFEGKIENASCDFHLVGYTTIDIGQYRSIGTNSAVLYSTGNATIAAGSKVMTFAGATLPSNVGVGDKITVGGDTYYIKTKDSAAQVTVHTASASPHTSAAYSIRRAYNTMQSWEDARDGNLVGENRREYGVCYNDGPFTATTRINDSTTDAAHYMTLTVAEGQRHNGTRGTGARIDAGGGFGQSVIDLQDQYTRIEWLEITNWKDGDRGLYFDEAPASDNGDNSSASNMLVYDYDAGTEGAFVCRCAGVNIRNCVFFDAPAENAINVRVGSTTVENCTIYGQSDGVHQLSGSTVSIRNTISVGNLDDDFDLEGTVAYFDYNMYSTTEDFTPAGTNDQTPPGNLDDLFISIAGGSEDLHLETLGHNALDTGLNLSSSFTTDIDGDTRSGTWDMGADEMTDTLAVNYRSIGTNAATLYSTGTASIASGSVTMTFAGGASLPSNVGVGDKVTIGADTYYIATRNSATQVTVDSASASTHTNSAYTTKRAYNDIQVWENARDGNLVGEYRREVGVCYNDGVFAPSARLEIAGSTTDATHYMMLTVADGQRHAGIPGTGAVIDGTGIAADIFAVWDEYTIIEWLRVTNINAGDDGLEFDSTNPATGSIIRNMLWHGMTASNNAIRVESDATIQNCMFLNGAEGIHVQDGAKATIENVTIYNMSGQGVEAILGTQVDIRNTIVVNSGATDFVIDGTVDYFGYNMYSTTSGFTPSSYQGGNQSPPGNLDNLFISIAGGSENVHLEPAGHNALDTGVNIAGFSTDIDGETRVSGSWDIGADEAAGYTNYRSIGTLAGTIYSTGSATVAAGGMTVTFAGATLPGNIGLGDVLVIGGETMYIMSRLSATQVTTQGSAASAHTAAAYTISRAYNDIQVWENARDGNLVSEKRREVGVLYADGVFTVPSVDININGSTTDATYYMKLTAAASQRHTGVAGTGVVIDCGGAGDGEFFVQDDYSVFEWFEMRNWAGAWTRAFDVAADHTLIQNVILHDFLGASRGAIYMDTGFDDLTFRNSIVYDGQNGIYVESGSGLTTVENVTIYGMTLVAMECGTGNGSTVVNNCIFVDSQDYDILGYGTWTSFSHNMFSTTFGFNPNNFGGNNQSPPADFDDLFFTIAPGSENLHLEDAGHNALGTGLDLSANFTIDVDGQTRTAPWDMGADAVSAPLWISSGQDQAFTVGDPDTAISPITITDAGGTPVITAAGDIRVRIPAGLDMEWDIFAGLATITGTASGKVSSVVSYEDANKTLVLDVTSDFAAGESIAVSDLNFSSFSTASSAAPLELDIDNNAVADATDDKTITISALVLVSGSLRVMSWEELEPGGPPSSPASLITFDNATTDVSGTARGSASFSHTISAGSCCDDAILVVVVGSRGDQGCSGVTYNGVPLAPSVSEQASTAAGNEWVQIFYLVNPPTGTNTVLATFNISETPTLVSAISYFGVDQSSPIGAVASASDIVGGTTVTVDIATTVSNSVVVGGLGHHGGDTDPHDAGGDVTTEHYDVASGTATGGDSGYAGGEIMTTSPGFYTFQWTNALADDWAIACVELRPAP